MNGSTFTAYPRSTQSSLPGQGHRLRDIWKRQVSRRGRRTPLTTGNWCYLPPGLSAIPRVAAAKRAQRSERRTCRRPQQR